MRITELTAQTTRLLFEMVEREGLRYAYLRNYEHLPSLQGHDGGFSTDIDLVMDSRDLPKWREILAQVAAECGWETVTYCDHWARSPIRHHNIDVFRMFSRDPFVCLQIDIFHGLLVYGVPLVDEQSLSRDSSYYSAKRVTRIDLNQQNVYRLVQMAALYPESAAKVKRYRQKVCAHAMAEGEAFRRSLAQYFGPAGELALTALLANDFGRFKRYMRAGQRHSAFHYARHHLTEIPRIVYHRLRDHLSRFYTDQCGAKLLICIEEQNRPLVRSILDEFVTATVMDIWIERSAGETAMRDHVLMEQGAFVIQWADADKASLDLRACPDREAIGQALLSFIIGRHEVLYAKDSNPSGVSHLVGMSNSL